MVFLSNARSFWRCILFETFHRALITFNVIVNVKCERGNQRRLTLTQTTITKFSFSLALSFSLSVCVFVLKIQSIAVRCIHMVAKENLQHYIFVLTVYKNNSTRMENKLSLTKFLVAKTFANLFTDKLQ